MKNIILITFIIFGMYQLNNAQDIESIQTDRPDQTESPAIVPSGYFQFEIGGVFEKSDNIVTSISHPGLLLKYGVNNRFEVRVITEYLTSKTDTIETTGFLPLALGFKTALMEENENFPSVSFLGHITVPKISAKEFKSLLPAPDFRLILQKGITESFSLGCNLGAEWDGETPEPVYIYTFVTGFSLSDNFGFFAEVYGFAPHNQTAEHRFDSGLTYLLNNDTQFDISFGIGMTEKSPKYFIGIGFSNRINLK